MRCSNCGEGLSGHRTGDPQGRPLCNRPHCHLTNDFEPQIVRDENGTPTRLAYHRRYHHPRNCHPSYPISPTFSAAQFAAVLAAVSTFLDAPRPFHDEPLFDLEADLLAAAGH